MIKRAGRVLYYRHYVANKFLTFLNNVLTDLNCTDVEIGYKAKFQPLRDAEEFVPGP